MRYEQAIRTLYALEPRGMSLGLRPMQRALAARGNPERALACVHVAGTNGKGSVSAMLASVLRQAGYRVGLFTSPHLHRLVERFRVNGRAMSTRELARRVAALQPFLAAGGRAPLTFFEVCTLLALEWFRDEGCDLCVIEVGIGGRLDCTNVVHPVLSVITHVAHDHRDKLGATLAAIAREKAGIIKRDVPVVSGVTSPAARGVIEARARRLSAPLSQIGREFLRAEGHESYRIRWGERTLALRLRLRGAFQAHNLACTVEALRVLSASGFPLSEAALRRGLAKVRWPGRLELLHGEPAVLCDAAHNPSACVELARCISGLSAAYGRRVLLFGVLRDKDYRRMLGHLLPHVQHVAFVTAQGPRGLSAHTLRAQFGGEAFEDTSGALAWALRRAGKTGLVIVAGSIFVMSAARAQLLRLPEDPKIAL